MNTKALLECLNNGPGYYSGECFNSSKDDLLLLRKVITNHINDILNTKHNFKINLRNKDIKNYHLTNISNFHHLLWTKRERILPPKYINSIKKCNIFKQLLNFFPESFISNEEKIYSEEIYWRIVRPDVPSDIGSLHADSWFWPPSTKKGVNRIKVWIPIFTETGKNGFVFVPDSQKESFSYRLENTESNRIKPILIQDLSHRLEKYLGRDGNAIVFHDNLIHGGFSGGSSTRISLEFTLFVKSE